MPVKDDNLIEILSDMGLVTDGQLAEARAEESAAAERGEGVVDVLVAKKYLSSLDVTRARAIQFGAEFIDLNDLRLDDDVITAVPRNIAKKYNVVPVFADQSSITIALSDPSDLDKIDTLQHLLKKEHFDYRVAPEDQIVEAINRYYGSGDDQVAEMLTHFTQGDIDMGFAKGDDMMGDQEAVDSDAPLVKLVNTVIADAFKARASDIHIEPMEKRLRIRYRTDGSLQEVNSPPKRLQNAVISRLKIQSGMSIAEKRIPQDGRIQLQINNKPIDLRVSCLPTVHGESIVMRILDKSGIKLGLSELGFLTDDQQTFERLIGMPDGILLVTGPTGSGKTTTLYSCLNYIN
ncbi:MAG: Flp pilus assembly complex ATPase component TadA, partial [Verrucomicrobia bacterium]|nr:Flp pilus assembly complex ATPase component TadA [Verrucomicrobiota bacterium]